MLFWIQYPFIRITISFCIGILLGNSYRIPFYNVPVITLCCLVLYSLILFVSPKNFRKYNVLLGSFSVLTMVLSGYATAVIRNPEINPNHIINHQGVIESYQVNVSNSLKSTDKFKKVIGTIIQTKSNRGWKKKEGKILLYFPISEDIRYGNQFLINGKPESIPEPGNPGEFDYRSYLKHKNIYHSQFLRQKDYLRLKSDPVSFLKKTAESSRKWITEKIHLLYSDSQTEAIVLALLTGQRNFIDRSTYNSFVDTGIIHILAVSGLHVGIIYFIILGICYPLPDTYLMRIIKWLFVISILVFFAILTGLQASVMRAVLMFSLVHTGKIINRNSNSLNSVSLSAFILLLINPDFLYFVGFQLSYSAVFGILLLAPVISKLFSPQHRIVKWFWNLGTLSLAAQLGTLPITLYYFKQFPLYFMISNYIAIPYASLTLSLGLLSILFYPVKILSPIIPFTVEFMSKLFLKAIYLIKELPSAVISPININSIQLFFLLAAIYLIFYGISKRKISSVSTSFFFILIVVLIDFKSIISSARTNEILVYNIPGYSCIEFANGNKSIMLVSDQSEKGLNTIRYHTQGYIINKNRSVSIHDMKDLVELFPTKQLDGILICIWENLSIGIINEKYKKNISSGNKINLDFLIIFNDLIPLNDIPKLPFQSEKIIWDTSNRYIHLVKDKFEGLNTNHRVSYDGVYKYSFKKF